MQLELKRAQEVVESKIVNLLFVVNVVNFDLKSVLLLEIVIRSDLLDETRTECIVNNFCLAKFVPYISLGLVQNKNGIRKTEGVRIGQVYTAERKGEFLSQSRPSTEAGCSKNCSVDV